MHNIIRMYKFKVELIKKPSSQIKIALFPCFSSFVLDLSKIYNIFHIIEKQPKLEKLCGSLYAHFSNSDCKLSQYTIIISIFITSIK